MVKGKGVGDKGSTFYFKQSFIVPDIFIVIFHVYNRCIGSILRQEL
jgi:hypothetical protein